MNEVVKLTYPEPSICLIKMEDRKSKNTFSSELMDGLLKSFDVVKQNHELKVVVVIGYDNFFACGGTQKVLNELNEGKMVFTDLNFYNLPFECHIPTIAAINGHSLGGGLAFACMFDFLVMSLESCYSANFMKYGFTPGLGATFNVPRKFGSELAKEMLFTAKDYSGQQLYKRNPELHVVTRDTVLEEALSLAREIASNTLISLQLLKRNYYEQLREPLYDAIKRELKMHEKTIVTPEAKERIEKFF